jgi:hypothetical protein
MSAPPSTHPTARAATGWRAQDQRAQARDGLQGHGTDLYTASFPGRPKSRALEKARRHDGLCDKIYREAICAGLLVHREYAPAVMHGHGLTDERRAAEGPRRDAASARPRSTATAKQAGGGAESPQEAVRVVDNVRTIAQVRPASSCLLLAHSSLTGARPGGGATHACPSR